MASGQPDYCCWDLCWYCTSTGKDNLFEKYITIRFLIKPKALWRGLILGHHCHLVVSPGNIKQTSFFWHLVLCGFFPRFLASASLKTWSAMSKLSKPTGDMRGEVREPCPSGPARVNTAHKPSRPAEDGEQTQNRCIRADTKSLIPCLSLEGGGRRKYPTQTKQSTLCLPPSWDFTQIYRGQWSYLLQS